MIKNAKEVRSSTRRRPAPAPPVAQGTSNDAPLSAQEKQDFGQGKKSQDIKSYTESPSHSSKVKHSNNRRGSAQSENYVKEGETEEDNVRKSKSVTSSIGHAPSLVSSYSSNASEVTTTSDSIQDSSKVSNGSNPFEDDASNEDDVDNKDETPQTPVSEQHSCETDTTSHSTNKSAQAEEIAYDSSKNPFEDDEEEDEEEQLSNLPPTTETVPESQKSSPVKDYNVQKSHASDLSEPQLSVSVADESFGSVASSNLSSPLEDLPPPPPPEVYDDISTDQFETDLDLPPAPPDLCPAEEGLRVDDMYVNLNSDILELCGQNSFEECRCENYQPRFDVKGTFFARYFL